jgi:hypothetical protein
MLSMQRTRITNLGFDLLKESGFGFFHAQSSPPPTEVMPENYGAFLTLEFYGAELTRNDQGEVVGVNLAGTKITDTGLAHLKGLTELHEFDLSGTKVTDTGLVHLKGLANLERLYLNETKTTDAGVADLQKALPDCQIFK